MPREPQRRSTPQFKIGDTVRMLEGDFAGYVGTITEAAHRDSPWTWVVRGHGDQGPGHCWGSAVNEDEIEACHAA